MKDNQFISPRPKYTPPPDPHKVLQAPIKDHTPAIPLKEQAEHKVVQQLLEEAKMLSQQDIKNTPVPAKTYRLPPVRYTRAHVLSDKDFVETTRSMKITDKGAMSLLIANGGIRYLVAEKMLPAQAFDALRREKSIALSRPSDASFDRRPQVQGKVRQPAGTPTPKERAAKIGMYLLHMEHKIQEKEEDYHEEVFAADQGIRDLDMVLGEVFDIGIDRQDKG